MISGVRLHGAAVLVALVSVTACGSVPHPDAERRRADVEFSVLNSTTPADRRALASALWQTGAAERVVFVEDNGASRRYPLFMEQPSNVIAMKRLHRTLEAQQPHVLGVFSVADFVGL